MRMHGLSLIMAVSVLCFLDKGLPGPACNSEWPNAQYNAGYLKNCVQHLHKLFLEEGYKDGGKRTHTCLPRGSEASDGPTQLDMISTQLCRYNTCLTRLAGSPWINNLPSNIACKIKQCQDKLSHLRNTISKMKHPRVALKQSSCEVAWPFAGTNWEEISIGLQFFKELLDYLKQLQFPCG